MDSCFRHLVESIPTQGKLFFHEYVRPFSARKYPGQPDVPTRKKWNVYPQSDFHD
jgi:hypothetical protein